MIKVVIVDDQDILKQGLKMILGRESDIEVCGLASNGREAYEICKEEVPDVVLMDIKMPQLNGVEATKKIKTDFSNIKIIVLTTFNDDEYIHQALRYGASGYILKDATPEKILEAIRVVNNGGALIQPNVAIKVIEQFSKATNSMNEDIISEKIHCLTDREKGICNLVGKGKNNKEISKELYLSEGTVKNYITKILSKLELRDRTQLAIFSIKNKLSSIE